MSEYTSYEQKLNKKSQLISFTLLRKWQTDGHLGWKPSSHSESAGQWKPISEPVDPLPWIQNNSETVLPDEFHKYENSCTNLQNVTGSLLDTY